MIVKRSELVMIEQFLVSVPEDLRIWRKLTSIRQAAGLADDYALAHKGNQKANPETSSSPPVTGTHTLENPGGSLGSKDHPQSKLIGDKPIYVGTRSVFSVASLAI